MSDSTLRRPQNAKQVAERFDGTSSLTRAVINRRLMEPEIKRRIQNRLEASQKKRAKARRNRKR